MVSPIWILLSFNAIKALVPLLLIGALIGVAAGLSRGKNLFAIFGVGTMLGSTAQTGGKVVWTRKSNIEKQKVKELGMRESYIKAGIARKSIIGSNIYRSDIANKLPHLGRPGSLFAYAVALDAANAAAHSRASIKRIPLIEAKSKKEGLLQYKKVTPMYQETIARHQEAIRNKKGNLQQHMFAIKHAQEHIKPYQEFGDLLALDKKIRTKYTKLNELKKKLEDTTTAISLTGMMFPKNVNVLKPEGDTTKKDGDTTQRVRLLGLFAKIKKTRSSKSLKNIEIKPAISKISANSIISKKGYNVLKDNQQVYGDEIAGKRINQTFQNTRKRHTINIISKKINQRMHINKINNKENLRTSITNLLTPKDTIIKKINAEKLSMLFHPKTDVASLSMGSIASRIKSEHKKGKETAYELKAAIVTLLAGNEADDKGLIGDEAKFIDLGYKLKVLDRDDAVGIHRYLNMQIESLPYAIRSGRFGSGVYAKTSSKRALDLYRLFKMTRRNQHSDNEEEQAKGEDQNSQMRSKPEEDQPKKVKQKDEEEEALAQMEQEMTNKRTRRHKGKKGTSKKRKRTSERTRKRRKKRK